MFICFGYSKRPKNTIEIVLERELTLAVSRILCIGVKDLEAIVQYIIYNDDVVFKYLLHLYKKPS